MGEGGGGLRNHYGNEDPVAEPPSQSHRLHTVCWDGGRRRAGRVRGMITTVAASTRHPHPPLIHQEEVGDWGLAIAKGAAAHLPPTRRAAALPGDLLLLALIELVAQGRKQVPVLHRTGVREGVAEEEDRGWGVRAHHLQRRSRPAPFAKSVNPGRMP